MIPHQLIESAPEEPESITHLRKTRPRTKRDGSNTIDEHIRIEKLRIAADVGHALAKTGFDKIKIQVGPTTYTLWNTKQNLQALNKRLEKKP